MKFFLGLLFASAAFAKNVDVTWRHEKATGKTSLTVSDPEKGKHLAETCGSILHADDPIDFSNLDGNGLGSFTVGTKEYTIHSNPDISGGPTCTKVYNDKVAVVNCVTVDWPSTKGIAKNETTNCFLKDESAHTFALLQGRNAASKREVSTSQEKIQERQWIGTCVPHYFTELKGDGNPHQNYFHKQLSETISCGNAQSCSVGQMESESYTIGWSISGAGAADFGWLSGGFSVSETWTTGNTYTCNGGSGETICIWYNIAHTAYTVQREAWECSASSVSYTDVIVKSPNENNRGGGYYCVVGTCRSQGDNYWDDSGRAGGP